MVKHRRKNAGYRGTATIMSPLVWFAAAFNYALGLYVIVILDQILIGLASAATTVGLLTMLRLTKITEKIWDKTFQLNDSFEKRLDSLHFTYRGLPPREVKPTEKSLH